MGEPVKGDQSLVQYDVRRGFLVSSSVIFRHQQFQGGLPLSLIYLESVLCSITALTWVAPDTLYLLAFS